jgi:hypothetical protein
MKKILLLCLISISFFFKSNAQITIAYPKVADSITRALDSTLLTVKVAFGASCNNTKLTIKMPLGVEYIPNSVTKIDGDVPSISIVESNVSNKRVPIFNLTGISAASDITFTVKRKADCAAGISGKDTILVIGDCGSFLENGNNINTYNILSPALSIFPAPPINDALIGDTYNRSSATTNGGNGCIDTLWLSIVYPGGGIELIGNQLNISGNTITPYKINGDTLFFKIFGKKFFQGRNIMCNGQSISFTENILVKKCDPLPTIYNSSWGKNAGNPCQFAPGSNIVNTTSGKVDATAKMKILQSVSYCRKGINEITYFNNGDGGNVSAMYNIVAYLGHNQWGDISNLPKNDPKITIQNCSINGNKITYTINPYYSNNNAYQLKMNQLTTDPDGINIGLEDIDGDGQFDDLAPGKSFTIQYEEKWTCDIQCGTGTYNLAPRSVLVYTKICDQEPVVTDNLVDNNPYKVELYDYSNVTAPLEVTGGVPFRSKFCLEGNFIPPAYIPTDSMYYNITFPTGFTFVGNVTANGVPVPASNYSFINNTLSIFFKNHKINVCVEYDMVYNCGTSGKADIFYNVKYVGDNSCNCYENLVCRNQEIYFQCFSGCNTGVINYKPTVKRISLGYTDKTLSTKVKALSVSAAALKIAMATDTVLMTIPGKQIDQFDNLYYQYQLKRANNSYDMLDFVSGIFYQKSAANGAITSCVVDYPKVKNDAVNDVTTFDFDLTTCLNKGQIQANDSIWLELKYSVSTTNSGYCYGVGVNIVPNTQSYFYNLKKDGSEVFCDYQRTDFSLLGLDYWVRANSNLITKGCTGGYLYAAIKVSYSGTGDVFPNEYRPAIQPDSIIVTIPNGYSFDSALPCYIQGAFWSTPSTSSLYPQKVVIPQVRGKQLVFINPKDGSWDLTDICSYNEWNAYDKISYAVKPNCDAQAYAAIKTEIFLKRYVYSGKPSQPYAPLLTNDLTYSLDDRPNLKLVNISGDVSGLELQHYWDVQIQNTSNQTAPNLWFALDKTNSGITIDSFVFKPTNAIATPINYGTAKDWYKLSNAGILGGGNQNLRIYFKYTNCNATDSIKMSTGWNCESYPNTPNEYTCNVEEDWLKVNPQLSQLQISISKQPDFPSIALCVKDTISVILNSALAGDVVDPILKIVLPTGIKINTPLMVEFPLNSGNWENINPTFAAGTYTLKLGSHSLLANNSLPGVAESFRVDGRGAKVNILYESDCDFTNGSKMNFIIEGTRPCGSPVIGNGDEIKTNPIIIAGSTTVGSVGTQVNIASGKVACGGTERMDITITPMFIPTTTTDTINITIPIGLSYANGSLLGCPTCVVSKSIKPDLTELIKVAIPAGLPINKPFTFSVGVNANDESTCEPYSIDVETIRTGTFLSCNASRCARPTPVVMSFGNALITVFKPLIKVKSFSLVGVGPFVTGGRYETQLLVENYGTLDAAAGNVVEIFCIADATPFTYITLPALTAGQSKIIFDSITIPSGCPGTNALKAWIRRKVVLPTSKAQCLCAENWVINAQVLAVTLIDFSAAPALAKNEIKWKVANENTGVTYQIQRSVDKTTFTNLTEVKVNRINNGEYTFTDNLQGVEGASKLYYRLQIINTDGNVSYSEIKLVSNVSSKGKLVVSPNPAQSTLQLSFTAVKNETVKITLFDTNNKKVKQWDRLITKGVNKILLYELDKYAGGAYIININSDTIDLNQNVFLTGKN